VGKSQNTGFLLGGRMELSGVTVMPYFFIGVFATQVHTA
jgi:hypothetical protein